jgi:hypothetical protein
MSPPVPRSISEAAQRDAVNVAKSSKSQVPTVSTVLNLAEAAALVRCSRAHLSNVINGKVPGIPRLPAVRIGRRVLFRRESLELWLQEVESMTSATFKLTDARSEPLR